MPRRVGVLERDGAQHKGVVLAVVLGVQAMAIIDLTVVNVAAPTIQADLGVSGPGLQLVVSGYAVTYAMALITGARLGERLGQARVMRAGLVSFVAASLACGLATGGDQLIAFRAVQGLAAGLMVPQVLSLIQRTFVGAERGHALGRYAAVVATAAVVGQGAGGLLVSADLAGSGWRAIFLINVPIGVALAFRGTRVLPVGPGSTGREMDVPGVVTSSAGTLALVLPLVLGPQQGWPVWCWASLAASVMFLALFVSVELRAASRGRSALVPGRLLRVPGLAVGSTTILLGMGANAGLLFVFALYFQVVLGLSAAATGLLFASTALGSGVSSLTWSRLPASWHRWLVPFGMAGCAVAFGLLAPLASTGRLVSAWSVVDLLAAGAMFGLAYSPTITLALRRVPVADSSDATGILLTMVQMGQVLGVAVLGTVYLASPDDPGSAVVRSALAIAGSAAAAAFAGLFLARAARA